MRADESPLLTQSKRVGAAPAILASAPPVSIGRAVASFAEYVSHLKVERRWRFAGGGRGDSGAC